MKYFERQEVVVVEDKMNNTHNSETGEGTVPRVETITDIPEHFQLVQDSQDIHAMLESCGLLNYESETGCLFVEVLDGDYGDIYMSTRYVPVLTHKVYKIR